MDNQITYPYIEEYLNELQMPEEGFLRELEAFARRENIPAATRPTARLLYLLARLCAPERILEIGTAVGYSALVLDAGAQNKAQIVTIEKDEERFLLARNNFRAMGALGRIKPICGDAEEELLKIEPPFQMAFIDAAKGASRRYFDLLLSKMTSGGLIITDNVLYGGRTAALGNVPHKHRTGVTAMREYLEFLCHDPRFVTSVLSVGDGVALTIVK